MTALSSELKNAIAMTIALNVDGAYTPGKIIILDGSVPDNVGDLTSQTELVSFSLQKPCYVSIENGVITIKPTNNELVMKSGIASFARITNGDGVGLIDINIGLIGSGADIQIPTLNIIKGSYIRMSSIKINGG